MLTKEEFLKGIKDLKIDIDDIVDGKRSYKSYNKAERVKAPHIYVDWCSGGQSGGSWRDTGDTDNHYAREGDTEPEFDDLDQVLAAYSKNISFLQYKVLVKKLVKRGSYSVNEYYGNHSNYATKQVSIDEFYNYLKENNLFNSN